MGGRSPGQDGLTGACSWWHIGQIGKHRLPRTRLLVELCGRLPAKPATASRPASHQLPCVAPASLPAWTAWSRLAHTTGCRPARCVQLATQWSCMLQLLHVPSAGCGPCPQHVCQPPAEAVCACLRVAESWSWLAQDRRVLGGFHRLGDRPRQYQSSSRAVQALPQSAYGRGGGPAGPLSGTLMPAASCMYV